MKKSVYLLSIILFVSILSGCIISKTPNANDVTMNLGEQKTFSIKVFPSNATYTWSMDASPLANTGKSYIYTAVAGKHTLTVRAKHGSSTDTQTWDIEVNSPPNAHAGEDQTVPVDAIVTLNGLTSTDIDGDIVSYRWEQTNGPIVILTNADTATAQFAASVAGGSVLTFELTVTDTGGLQATDTCVITVTSLPAPIIELLSSLVTLPAGSFMMGSIQSPDEKPIHQVTLQAFHIGAFEVTQGQYEAVMGINPSLFQPPTYQDMPNRPVEQVSLNDAKAFCQQLSVITGQTFTLPSEAQWEYACRAGTTTRYSFGDDTALLGDYAWFADNIPGMTITEPVGMKLPSPWGLYDTYGNVWEWCLDSWHSDYVGAPTDGSAWAPDAGPTVNYLVRGGSVTDDYWEIYSARRGSNGQGWKAFNLGFRVVSLP